MVKYLKFFSSRSNCFFQTIFILFIELFVMFASVVCIEAQPIVIKDSVIDLGLIPYRIPVTATFEIESVSKESFFIEDVSVPCGCITLESVPCKSYVSPMSGAIIFDFKITYDARQLGRFSKTVLIKTSLSDEFFPVTIKGRVMSDIEDFYNYSVCDLFFDKKSIDFGDVRDSSSVEINLLNAGSGVYVPSIMHLPEYITAECLPSLLLPGQRGKIILHLNSGFIPDYGLRTTNIYLSRFPGDTVSIDSEIRVSTVFLPSFSVTEVGGGGFTPSLRLSQDTISIDLGAKSRKGALLTIENRGFAPLTIFSLQVFMCDMSGLFDICVPGIRVSLESYEIPAGGNVKMKVSVDRSDLPNSICADGKLTFYIMLICNDPSRSKVMVEVDVLGL